MARHRVYAYGGMTIFDRLALLEMGGFSPDLNWYSDWFCVLVLTFRYGACYIPETLATMRMLPGSYSAAGTKDSTVQEAMFRRIFELLQSEPFADVRPLIHEAGALCMLGSHILPVLLADSRYREFLSPRLLGRLAANIPVTLMGLNPATESPFRFLDRAVRATLGLDGRVQSYGVPLDG
jgi:hypothetical protein